MAEATGSNPEGQPQTPAETPPVLTADEVARIVQSAIDARMPGYMSSVDKRFNQFQQELQRATMTPDEVEEQEAKAEADELARLRRENAILSAGADYPEAIKVFKQMNSLESGKEQLEFLQSLIKPPSGNAAPDEQVGEEDSEEESAPVDSNRRSQSLPQNATGEQADSVLQQFKEWPIFRR